MVSIIEKICDKLVIFKWLNISCCNKAEESKSDKQYNIDNFYNFDGDFILAKHPHTADFFDLSDLGKFVVDIDGFCLYLNDKISEMFGEKKDKIKYNLIYAFNLFRDEMEDIINIWVDALKNKKPLLYKERRVSNGKIIYLIIEAYQYYSRNGCLGMRGIAVRVTKQVWNKFDVKKINREYLKYNESKIIHSDSN